MALFLNPLETFVGGYVEKLYDVYLNYKLTTCNVSEKEAWDVIGKSPIGTCYMVFLAGTDKLAVQFIPY